MSKISEYIKEQDFFKRDTGGDILSAFNEMTNKASHDETSVIAKERAVNIIESIVSAIRNEYGE